MPPKSKSPQPNQEQQEPKSPQPEIKKEKQPDISGSVGEGFVPPAGQRKLYHARIDRDVKFDPKTGKRISNSFVKAFTAGEWKQFTKEAVRIGYEYTLLWNPEIYLK